MVIKKKVVKKATSDEAPVTKKRVAKKPVGRKTRTRRQVTPVVMTQELRGAAARALAEFEEQLMEYESVGFTGSTTRDFNRRINGKSVHVGFRKTVKFEVGTEEKPDKRQAIITVQYR
jgi:hypothetical protein